jgi:hypothetical protein
MKMIQANSTIKKTVKMLKTTGKQMPFAMSKAINATAFESRTDTLTEIKAKIDRPTPYTLQSIWVKVSTKKNLVAYVGLSDFTPSKGTNYRDALGHLFTGGARVKKKSEYSLVNKGQFQGGRGFLGIGSGANADAYGNLSKSMIVTLMSYFNAFKEVGYKANMTDRKRKNLAKGKRIVGPLQPSPYKKINGVVYFMSRGKGWFVGQGKGWAAGRNQPLGAGIWSKTGTHGAVVKPIMTAIKQPTYKRLIDLPAIVDATVKRTFKKNFADAFAYAMKTAR